MKTLLVVALVVILGVSAASAANSVFDCYSCSGDGCQTSPKTDSCPPEEKCFKIEVRKNEDVDNPYIIKGCTEDKSFWKRTCYDDCRENQHFGSDVGRVCIYCCDDPLCNSAGRSTMGLLGVLLAALTLLLLRNW